MNSIDIYPDKAQYRAGETVRICVETGLPLQPGSRLECRIFHFQDCILHLKKPDGLTSAGKGGTACFSFLPSWDNRQPAGFGVEVRICDETGSITGMGYTAFDLAESWSESPRYGFLSDFSPKDKGDTKDLEQMNKYHLNVIQFYDWMYRHDDLIPMTEEFQDPLNRTLSRQAILNKIALAHTYGMQAIGYGAVYGASPKYFNAHREEAIYKNTEEVFGFSGFLYMMDISRENSWHDHICEEFLRAVKFGFDGIHMDQYGYPREAVCQKDGIKKIRFLRDDFPILIQDVRTYIEQQGERVGLIFNAVNNWPVETVAPAAQDAVYIEVWPPNDTYQDLYKLICGARQLAPEKQVILAAYLKPFLAETNIPMKAAQNSALLAMAVIFAGGGFHLLLGENNGILDDPYYPKYRTVKDPVFIRRLRDYYDFITQYKELLFDTSILDITMTATGGINEDYLFSGSSFSPKAERGGVWTLIKEKPAYKIIQLVNFTGIDNMNWNEAQEKQPDTVKNISISVLTCHKVQTVCVASPDINHGKAAVLSAVTEASDHGTRVRFTVPKLKVWNLVYLVCSQP